jgi:hypothetical protein
VSSKYVFSLALFKIINDSSTTFANVAGLTHCQAPLSAAALPGYSAPKSPLFTTILDDILMAIDDASPHNINASTICAVELLCVQLAHRKAISGGSSPAIQLYLLVE